LKLVGPASQPGKLALQRALLAARPDLASCFGDFRIATLDGVEREGGLAGWLGGPTSFKDRVGPGIPLAGLLPAGSFDPSIRVHLGDFAPAALHQTIVNIGTVLVRKERVGPELGCAEDLPTYEELPAVARILRAGPAAFLDGALLVQHDHPGPRLTGADQLVRARARIAVLQRSWAGDPAFLARHGEELAGRLRRERLALARLLLREGDARGARRVLEETGSPPGRLRWLARLPDPALAAGLAARRGLRRLAALLPWLPLLG
jgi:hypothetical protein